MPRLSDAQFQDYEFRAQKLGSFHQPTTNVVVGKWNKYDEIDPIGSMGITQEFGERYDVEQTNINRGVFEASGAKARQGQTEEPGGQQRWAGGNMDPRLSRVSWLGMSEQAPKSLLRGMMGLGVAVHGSVPVADYDLSQHGAKIAQGVARKYGVKSHPRNPEMESSFTYDEPEYDEYGGYDEAQAEVQSQASNMWGMSDSSGLGVHSRHAEPTMKAVRSRWQSFTAAQVGDITKEVEVGMLGRKPGKIDPRVPVHPSQGKLF